jgi:hypothetical protein
VDKGTSKEMTRTVSWNKRYHQLRERIRELSVRVLERIEMSEAIIRDGKVPGRDRREYQNMRVAFHWQRSWASLLYEVLENQNRLYEEITKRDAKITETLGLILKWKKEYQPTLNEAKQYFEDKAGRIIRP